MNITHINLEKVTIHQNYVKNIISIFVHTVLFHRISHYVVPRDKIDYIHYVEVCDYNNNNKNKIEKEIKEIIKNIKDIKDKEITLKISFYKNDQKNEEWILPISLYEKTVEIYNSKNKEKEIERILSKLIGEILEKSCLFLEEPYLSFPNNNERYEIGIDKDKDNIWREIKNFFQTVPIPKFF